MYFHMASLTWDDGETFKEWKEIARETSAVEADVTELVVELRLGDEQIASQVPTKELGFLNAIFEDLELEDGEYTIVVKGIVNGVEFEKTGTVTIVDNISESVNFLIEIQLDDIEIGKE